jgi:hypothetical protein
MFMIFRHVLPPCLVDLEALCVLALRRHHSCAQGPCIPALTTAGQAFPTDEAAVQDSVKISKNHFHYIMNLDRRAPRQSAMRIDFHDLKQGAPLYHNDIYCPV